MDDTEVMNDEELQHHGIKGMKWGHRRFQNKDGSLTPAGRERYADDYEEYETYHKERQKQERKERTKTLLKVGAAAAAGAIAVIGIKKYIESKNSDTTAKGENVVKEALKKAAEAKAAGGAKSESLFLNRDMSFAYIGNWEKNRKEFNKEYDLKLPQDSRYKDWKKANKANQRNAARSAKIAADFEKRKTKQGDAVGKALLKAIRRAK